MPGSNPFVGGKGLFTADDPGSALRANPPPTWVAVLPDKVTPELAQSFKDKGIALVIWEPNASQAGVDAVKQYGAAGYIAQAEGPGELEAANAIAAQLGDVPKALVSNNFMDAYPPGWIAMPEAYTNNNPQATADQVTRDAQARGATVVVPVIGLGFVETADGRMMSAAEYQASLDAAYGAGAQGAAAYIAEQTSDADLNAFTAGSAPSAAPVQPPPKPAPAPKPPAPPPASAAPVPVPPKNPVVPVPPPVAGPPPAPPYQQGPQGPQFAEGPLGENWNLGWQGAPAPPYQQNPLLAQPQPYAPQQVMPRLQAALPTQVPQSGTVAQRLNPQAILSFLNQGAPPLPPYVDPARHWGF